MEWEWIGDTIVWKGIQCTYRHPTPAYHIFSPALGQVTDFVIDDDEIRDLTNDDDEVTGETMLYRRAMHPMPLGSMAAAHHHGRIPMVKVTSTRLETLVQTVLKKLAFFFADPYMFCHIRIIKKSCQGKFITVGTLPIKVTPTEETHGDGTATTVDLALCVNPSSLGNTGVRSDARIRIMGVPSLHAAEG